MSIVLDQKETDELLRAANTINKINRRGGHASIYYREPGELLLIRNGELLESYQITRGKKYIYIYIRS